MVSRQHVQGDYSRSRIIQSPEVSSSSSSDVTTQQLHTFSDQFIVFPESRRSYRISCSSNNMHIPDTNRQRNERIPVLQGRCNCIQIVRYVKTLAETSTRGSMITLGGIFLSNLLIIWSIYRGFPELQEEEKPHIKIPWNLDDAKNLGIVLDRYKQDNFYHVYFGVSIMYIFLQTFAIPGSLFLSVLSGFLFNFWQAMLLVSTCSAVGASLCFLISHLLGRRIIFKYFPERAASWGATVNKHRDNLLNYVIFLRVTPFLPNWFINLTAPVIGVPLMPFALGTLIGVIPPSFVALQAGQTLHSMSAEDAKVSWTSMSLLIGFGLLSLLPIYFKDKLKKKFD